MSSRFARYWKRSVLLYSVGQHHIPTSMSLSWCGKLGRVHSPGYPAWQTSMDASDQKQLLSIRFRFVSLIKKNWFYKAILTDIFRFIEPTHKYKTPFEICTQSCKTLFYNETFLDKLCLIYHNNSHVEAVSCDVEYAALCVYPALHRQNDSLCSQLHATYCKQGNYNPTNLCYCKCKWWHLKATVLDTWLYNRHVVNSFEIKVGLWLMTDYWIGKLIRFLKMHLKE